MPCKRVREVRVKRAYVGYLKHYPQSWKHRPPQRLVISILGATSKFVGRSSPGVRARARSGLPIVHAKPMAEPLIYGQANSNVRPPMPSYSVRCIFRWKPHANDEHCSRNQRPLLQTPPDVLDRRNHAPLLHRGPAKSPTLDLA